MSGLRGVLPDLHSIEVTLCNNSTCKHTHSYTSTAYTTPFAEWPSPEERE